MLDAPWTWRVSEPDADARYALYRALEEEQEAAATVLRGRAEPARILDLAQVAFGRLRGVLVGIDDALLDRAPADGEWSIRRTLDHAIGVERSYRANVQHAITRSADEPLTLPAERRPAPDPADTAGGVLDIVAAFARRRAETDAALSTLDDAQMLRPSQWGPYKDPHVIDVRFRLHRFASHIAEHTVQCETTIAALGVPLTDPRAIVRAIGATRGAHERRTSPVLLAALDAALTAKADALGV